LNERLGRAPAYRVEGLGIRRVGVSGYNVTDWTPSERLGGMLPEEVRFNLAAERKKRPPVERGTVNHRFTQDIGLKKVGLLRPEILTPSEKERK